MKATERSGGGDSIRDSSELAVGRSRVTKTTSMHVLKKKSPHLTSTKEDVDHIKELQSDSTLTLKNRKCKKTNHTNAQHAQSLDENVS